MTNKEEGAHAAHRPRAMLNNNNNNKIKLKKNLNKKEEKGNPYLGINTSAFVLNPIE